MDFPTSVVPLPRDELFSGQPSLQQAYERLLTYENDHAGDPLPARWLGHLLREVLRKEDLAREITSCEGDTPVKLLSDFYRDTFLRLFRTEGRPTPAPSDHSSRSSMHGLQDDNVPRDHSVAKRLALIRDDGRSISGHFDMSVTNPQGPISYTNAVHIIPFSLNSKPGGVLTVLERIAGIVPGKISGERINRLSNIITMNMDHHAAFDDLIWWMEPSASGVPHHYVVRRILPYPGLPDNVHFASNDLHLELPDPKFIATHAACCRAAHLSGAAQHINTVYREADMTYVLAENGSSASLLEFALSKLVLAPPAT